MDRWESRALVLFVGLCLGAVATYLLMGFDWPSTTPAEGCVEDCLNQLDLIAQRSMADAAWTMVAVSAVGTAVGGISLWLIRENLVEARKLRSDSARSATAAELAVEQARIANQTTATLGQAQVRAYLTVTGVELLRLTAILVSIKLSNAGQSPARLISMKASMSRIIDTSPRDYTGYRRYFPDLPAGSKIDIDISDMDTDLDVLFEIDPNIEIKIHVLGTIMYSDVFGHRHAENFEFYGTVPPVPSGRTWLSRRPQPDNAWEEDPVQV